MKIAIAGTQGVPAAYGGFETLADNLAQYHKTSRQNADLWIYCSSANRHTNLPRRHHAADLRYIRLQANGAQSVLYDIASMLDAIWRRADVIILLGVSGALILPLLRLFSRTQVICNIDGIEWQRPKWGWAARLFLQASEWAAVRFAHVTIADNDAIRTHVDTRYGRSAKIIAYGGDHALSGDASAAPPGHLPRRYALALCRIEPENNIETILRAFSTSQKHALVFVGNWDHSAYGRALRDRYGDQSNLHLLDPIYDPDRLLALRRDACLYVHGHSAGGTNPSLVEMMHFAVPVLAYDCTFNRATTQNQAAYFSDASGLRRQADALTKTRAGQIANAMKRIADKRYVWSKIGAAYFNLCRDLAGTQGTMSVDRRSGQRRAPLPATGQITPRDSDPELRDQVERPTPHPSGS